jgi:peroxiredoxin
MDDPATMKRFKDELKATYVFVPDPDGKIVALYDVKSPMSMAKRYTFVVGQDRKIVDVQTGSDAIDPSKSIAACPVHKGKAPPADAKKPEGPKKGS